MPAMTTLRPSLLTLALLAATTTALAKEKQFELKSDDQLLVAPMNVASLNRLSLAALGGSPGTLGTFLPLFDRRLDTAYTAKEAGPATINVTFHRPQKLHAVRLLLGEGRYEWSVAVADT